MTFIYQVDDDYKIESNATVSDGSETIIITKTQEDNIIILILKQNNMFKNKDIICLEFSSEGQYGEVKTIRYG